ncbi:DUF229 domain-containing protein [Haloarcula sp. CBA1130]|uniref:sulfatase n=1 Tax=unclassified Haloarcula TaxID=2624677 RepID=UPI0012462526|nr:MULTISPECIES: sulfatase [unclassified Haloarcula]KAA9398353.1 DUF229 domain-containing protein [Haloarcula sp. CBA1129]KAA9402052.1 DUF229 domain-containing protein [Haloarcula sp. CBA1130]
MAVELPNIVLLTIDALRADHLSGHGYDRDTSPELDALLEDGLWFDTAFSASSHTAEAVPSILTGRYPDEAINTNYRLDTSSIAERLTEKGYATGAFHSNPYVSRAYGYGAGFDEFDDDLYLSHHKFLALFQRLLDIIRNKHYASAEAINERSLAWIDSVDDGPFFCWNHYMDVHGPYQPPAEHQRRFHGESVEDRDLHQLYKRSVSDPKSITDEEHRILSDFYDGEIRYTDEMLAAFLDSLAQRDLLDDSVVIITGDHGDGFAENGYYAHPRTLDDELLRVPLIVLGLDEQPARVSVPTSTLDIVPTILSVLGKPDSTLPGDSLEKIAQDPESYRNRHVFSQVRGDEDDNKGNLRRFRIQDGTNALALERDIQTNEVTVAPDSSPDLAEPLVEHSERRIATHGDADSKREEVDVDGDIQRRLEALGYK